MIPKSTDQSAVVEVVVGRQMDEDVLQTNLSQIVYVHSWFGRDINADQLQQER